MALQTSNLIIVGLVTLKDAPPNSEQPPLVDGIHLRWASKSELGFPWHGFYLFRRRHERGTLSWLSQHTRNLPIGTWPSTLLQTPLGRVSSDTNLVLTEDFPPPDAAEFDLAARTYLRVTFPVQSPVRRVEARIGFRTRPADPPPTRNTVSFTGLSPSRGNNPRTENGVVFETRDQKNQPRPNTFIRSVQTSSGPITGLGCKFKLLITLPQPATFVEVTLTGASRRDTPDGTPTIEAFNQDKTRADSASMRDPGSQEPETFILTGTAITTVVIDEQHPSNEPAADQDRVILNEISFGRASISEVQLTALSGTTPVQRIDLHGYAGRIVPALMEFDGISAIELRAPRGLAALVDLGVVWFGSDATIGWEQVPEFQYPLRLPITHPDYPCTPQTNEDFASAKQLAAVRIKYGNPAKFTGPPIVITNAGTVTVTNGSAAVTGAGTNWTPALLDAVFQVNGDTTVYTVAMVVSPTELLLTRNYSGVSRGGVAYTIFRDAFGQLYSYLVSLVEGGRAAGSMDSRTIRLPPPQDEGAPHMPVQSPLDMVLLGTLHPAVAQMTGVYWADRTADPALSYDYMIVGDYTGVAALNPATMLAHLQQNGFDNVEASIVYNIRLLPAPALTGPDGLNVYALPGSTRLNETGQPEEAINNVGLRWNLDKTDLGVLLPGRPVMYHLWRAVLGNGVTPNAPARYDLLSRDRPIVIAANRAMPETAPDWPPFPLHALDNALADGWYSYQVNGIDIFGRHTRNSAASAWRQWVPPPEPRPWYYQNPPGDTVINPSAIRLLTKIAPSSPTGVEAYALDPDDPTLIKDTAYSQWWDALRNSTWYQQLSEEQRKNLIGLRVRWAWTQEQMQQAPHTREFRIYYQPGHLNALLGNTKQIVAAGTVETDVITDIENTLQVNSYVGAALYSGDDAFVIVGSQPGSPLRVRVRNVGPQDEITPTANAPCTVATPPAYSAGTVSVVNGSNVITGAGTRWLTTLAGMIFRLATDTRSYRVASVDSETQLTLDQAYAGPSQSDRVYSIRHPLFVDYSLASSWQRRFYVVNFDQHWTPATDESGQPPRLYEVFLPAPEETIHDGVPLTPTLAEPIAYAHIGISAADDKTYTLDDPKWTGPWAGRFGNEGRVGPPAKIFRVLREPPPTPLMPAMPERQFTTRANSDGKSFYTYRWRPADRVKTQIFRALDDAVFTADWSRRPGRPLEPTQLSFFPSEATDSRWNAAKRQQVANELNQLNNFGRDETGTAQAFAYYRALSPDALRVLAGLSGNDEAFTPVPFAPLDPDDPAWANRRGPDDPDNFQIGDPNNPLAAPSLRIFIDTLDGHATNRYFYQSAYIDAAQNRSNTLSLSTPPVFVPKVTPPDIPLVQLALSAQGKVRLQWMKSAELDLAHYLVYRTAERSAAIDPRLMTLIAQVAKSPAATPAPGEQLPIAVPGKPWLEYSDPAPPAQVWLYRLVSVDTSGNHSEPSEILSGTAPPSPLVRPVLNPPAWDADHKTVTLGWTASAPNLESFVERRQLTGPQWTTPIWVAITGWLPAGHYTHVDTPPDPALSWEYRIRVRDEFGQTSDSEPQTAAQMEKTP